MYPLSVAVRKVVVVAEARNVPRVPIQKLDLWDAVIFSDSPGDANRTTGRESANRYPVFLPDNSSEYFIGVRLAQIDERGSTSAGVGGAFTRDSSADGSFLTNMLGGFGCGYRLTESSCDGKYRGQDSGC
jgi:hypothetical protein